MEKQRETEIQRKTAFKNFTLMIVGTVNSKIHKETSFLETQVRAKN